MAATCRRAGRVTPTCSRAASARCSPSVAAAAAFQAGEAQQEQQHPGADDRADEADGVEAVHSQRVVLYQVLQEPADEGPGDAEHDGAEYPDRVTAGHEQARDRADDEPDDQEHDDEQDHGGKTPLLRVMPHKAGYGRARGAAAFQAGEVAPAASSSRPNVVDVTSSTLFGGSMCHRRRSAPLVTRALLRSCGAAYGCDAERSDPSGPVQGLAGRGCPRARGARRGGDPLQIAGGPRWRAVRERARQRVGRVPPRVVPVLVISFVAGLAAIPFVIAAVARRPKVNAGAAAVGLAAGAFAAQALSGGLHAAELRVAWTAPYDAAGSPATECVWTAGSSLIRVRADQV